MTKMQLFLKDIITILESAQSYKSLNCLEKLGIKIGIYSIFEKNFNYKEFYSEIINYFESKKEIEKLVPEIQKYFIKIK